ncbi:SOS response-associated peptidase family protein [Vibrio sp. SCSIO 43135]|uniref:SOS response-associated peptidase n=1 Tax=Vibrio sp. SCSIO 43135 TaxID=2819096 RepID=UPI002075FDDB|nr:SOS response-associated peptidase family protein [Vibrio sp. SCSIO 43135]USD40185.1 SOS response-associated peptidase family protein [Vibrio sp. SCSIO 43135]
MCGRLNIIDDPLTRLVSQIAGIRFTTKSNSNLCPTDSVSVLATAQGRITQRTLSWGIKPHWAQRLIINAQAETAAIKPTFKPAIHQNRVIIPCSGWYEWTGEKNHKEKYLFRVDDSHLTLMAGIALGKHLVTLTTQANERYRQYHHRMPLLVQEEDVFDWLGSADSKWVDLLESSPASHLLVARCA